MQNREELGSHVQMRERRTAGRRRRLPEPERFGGDSGAVMAEAALITPVFFFLMFGILEFGGAFRDYLTLSSSVTAGARQEAIQGTNLQADWLTLQAIKSASSAMPLSQINMVVIFKASGPSASVSAACKTGGQTVGTALLPQAGSCNRFVNSDFTAALGPSWDCTTGPIRFWCPTVRNVGLSGGVDYLGVYMQIRHPWVTGLFGQSVTMSDTAITKLEPQKV